MAPPLSSKTSLAASSQSYLEADDEEERDMKIFSMFPAIDHVDLQVIDPILQFKLQALTNRVYKQHTLLAKHRHHSSSSC